MTFKLFELYFLDFFAFTQKYRTFVRYFCCASFLSTHSGTPEGTRTPSLQNRNLTLYPIALRARLLTCCFIIAIFPPFVKENFRTPGKDGKYGENPWTSPLVFVQYTQLTDGVWQVTLIATSEQWNIAKKAMKRRVPAEIRHREPRLVGRGAEGRREHGLGAAHRAPGGFVGR